jgi:hypothetical protein
MIRLFPVPYRLMDDEKRFSKWQWIDVSVLKAAKSGRKSVLSTAGMNERH